MASQSVNVQLPEELYHRLEQLAGLTQQPVNNLIVRTLSSSIPSIPDNLPTATRDALLALERLSDNELWDVTRATLPDSQYEELTALREKQRDGSLTNEEQGTLERLLAAVDLLTLEKAYAAVLLKWRGNRAPSPTTQDA